MSYRSYGSSGSRYSSSERPSTDASSYQPGSYRSSISASTYTPRDRSASRDRYSSTLQSKDIKTDISPRTSYSRSNSTLSERDIDKDKKSTYTSTSGAGYKRYGTSPSRTVSYGKLEEKKSPTTTVTPATPTQRSEGFKYANPYTSSVSNRFLTTAEKESNLEGKYTYRTRPQPVFKNLEISIPKSDSSSPLSPLSPSRAPLSPLSPARSPISSLSPSKPPLSPLTSKLTPTSPKPPPSPPKRQTTDDLYKNLSCTISVVTRSTSPNPPSSYIRARRSEIATEIQRDVARPRNRPECRDQCTQTERIEETPSRFSRFGSRTTTPWSSYLDRVTAPVSSVVSKYSSTSRFSDSPRSTYTRPSRLDLDTSPRSSKLDTATVSNKSPVSAADKLKDSISSLVATLQSSPLNKRETSPKKRISPPKNERPKTQESNKIETKTEFKKAVSPEKIKIAEKVKVERKSKSPEKLLKANSPEKLKKSESNTDSLPQGIPTDSNKVKSGLEPVKLSKASSKSDVVKANIKAEVKNLVKVPSKTDINKTNNSKELNSLSRKPSKSEVNIPEVIKNVKEPSKNDISETTDVKKLPKMPSKINIARRRTSKDDTPEPVISKSNSSQIDKDNTTSDKTKLKPSEQSPLIKKKELEILQNSSEIKEIPKCKSKTDTSISEDSTSNSKSNSISKNISKTKIIKTASKVSLTSSRSSSESSESKSEENRFSPQKEISNSNSKECVIKKKNESTSPQKEPYNSKNRISPQKERISPQKENMSRITPRRSSRDDDPVILEQLSSMSSDLIISPMKIEARSQATSPRHSSERSPSLPKKPPPSPTFSDQIDTLPPLSPKLNTVKNSSSLNAIPKSKVANKDFRKSPLNMSEDTKRASSEGHSPMSPRKPLKSVSKISVDECISESTDEMYSASESKESGIPKISISRSPSINNKNVLVTAKSPSSPSVKSDKEGSQKKTQFIRQSRSSRHDSSSTSSSETEESSEEEEESSEESEDDVPQSAGISAVLKPSEERRIRASPNSATSEDISSLPVDNKSKTAIEKPPLPPTASTNKAASFLMRALAPVTNLLWVNKKHDVSDKSGENSEEIRRSNTSQSISELHDTPELSRTDDELEPIKKPLCRSTTENLAAIKRTRSKKNIKCKKRPVSTEILLGLFDAKKSMDTLHLTAGLKNIFSKSSENVNQIDRNQSSRSLPDQKKRPVSCDFDRWINDEEKLDNVHSENLLKPSPSVQKIFKSPSGEQVWALNSTEDISDDSSTGEESESDSEDEKVANAKKSQFKFNKFESGERAWWLQSTGNIPEGIAQMKSSTSLNKDTQEVPQYKLPPQLSGEKAWWQESSENIPEGIQREPSSSSLPQESQVKRFSLRHVESGEKAWWMESNENIPEGIVREASSPSIQRDSSSPSVSKSEEQPAIRYRIRPQQSGELAWWLQSTDNVPQDVSRESSSKSLTKSQSKRRIARPDSGEWWKQSQDNLALSEGLKRTDSIRSTKPPDGLQRSDSLRSNKARKIRHVESGERAWWMESMENVPEGITRIKSQSKVEEPEDTSKWYKLRPQASEDKPWWLDSSPNIPEGVTQIPPSSSETESESDSVEEASNSVPKFPLEIGERTSPDGLDMAKTKQSGRHSPYDNVGWLGAGEAAALQPPLFIGTHTNIDDLLGAEKKSAVQNVQEMAEKFVESTDNLESSEEEEEEVTSDIPEQQISADLVPEQKKLDDVSLQLYKDGDYGNYLDLEASLSEQHEELEGFLINRKNSIVLRTQLSVRVHTIIEKLLNSEGRELRRALFSLKQIFQEDKDLVHEFVQNDGLACLIKVGSEADQNYQNYILRALGQVMLYVDGMNGVMAHNETVQWLYSLISSKFRLVVKTALKLLLVFVEYKETNCLLLIRAIRYHDLTKGLTAWCNVMRLLSDYDTSDTELLVYASSLINKTLNGIPDQDTYYDQVDVLEEQGIEGIIQRFMSRQGTDLDLLRQFQIYEAVLHHEDGEDKGTPLKHLDDTIRKTLRHRKSSESPNERRKSRRHSGLSPSLNGSGLNGSGPQLICSPLRERLQEDEESETSSSRSSPSPSLSADMKLLNGGSYADNNKANVGVTPALRRRRERAERQRSFMKEQSETAALLRKPSADLDNQDDNQEKNNQKNTEQDSENWQPSRTPSRQDLLMNAVNDLDSKDGIEDRIATLQRGEVPERKVLQLNMENTVKDLTQKLANSNILSPTEDKVNRIGDMTGIISKAMEGLAKSKSKNDLKESPTKIVPEIKKSETEIQWDSLLENMSRPLTLCDLDFTDLHSDDEMDILAPNLVTNGIPPPPPPLSHVPPPPPVGRLSSPPPIGAFGVNLKSLSPYASSPDQSQADKSVKKSKKTLKLFWKEVREDPGIIQKLQKVGQSLIWDELSPVTIDTQKLEHLFESRAKEINPKTKQESNKAKEIIVLDPKRSNAINIGMTKLPPPRAIKTAILKMDSTVMNREGIEKLFAMLPTEEERNKIQEAQVANPDIPLGSAEQFLLTMASITELPARLKLWAFKLDYENIEKEIAEPVMDLKQGMEILKSNRTFRCILGTLLSIGIFLNGNEVKGFQIEYLAKVPEVKDTVHKHSLLHHLCHMVMEKFPDSTDLYSEIGAVTRASKVDFDELTNNIHRLESECKASWDYLKVIAKHDGSSATKNKMSEFLTDCAQRIIVLSIVHRRIMNRFHKFLLWLGTPPHRIHDTKPNDVCRIVSEFALEYRTTRERVLQQLEKKANHRERNKTRGKMITEVGKFRTKECDRADAELRQLLGGDVPETTESLQGTWRRQRKDGLRMNSLRRNMEGTGDGDDEILESLVKTATKSPGTRTTPRERKRTRHADRKSLRRTLKNGLSEEEKKHLAAYIKGY